MMSSTTNIPIWFDEYKPTDIGSHKLDSLHDLIRKSTRGGQESKGNQSMGTDIWRITSPIILSGEQEIQGSAEQRRAITTQLKESTTDKNTKYRRNWVKLTGGSWQHQGERKYEERYDTTQHAKAVYNYVLKLIQEENLKQEWREAKEKTQEVIEEYDVQDLDVIKCSMVKMGLTMYKHFAHIHDANIDIKEEDIEDAIIYVAEQSTDESRINHVDEFMILMEMVASTEEIEYGKHIKYTQHNASKSLKIDLGKVHSKVSKFLRDHDLDSYDLLNKDKDYRERMKDMAEQDDSYVLEVSKKDRDLGRCIELDEGKMVDEIEGYEKLSNIERIENHINLPR
jgi:hypothetical protein